MRCSITMAIIYLSWASPEGSPSRATARARSGKAMDIEKRLSGYTTSYIDNTEVKFLSELCCDYSLAELIIFDRLKSNRIKQNREFFKGNINDFILIIEDVVKKVNDKSITARENNKRKDMLNHSMIYRKHNHWHMHAKL